MEIQLVKQKLSPATLKQACDAWFGDMVKITIDIKNNLIALGGDLHADAETLLLQQGSDPADIWGANFYPFLPASQRIEYTALINIRPRHDHPALEIQDPAVRRHIKQLVETLLLHPNEDLVP